jgi:hypothetical protein
MDIEDFVKCVLNLLALLPSDIRLEVQKRESVILKTLNEKIKDVCGTPSKDRYEYYRCLGEKRGEIALRVVEELNTKNYYYIIYCLAAQGEVTYAYCQNLLDIALVVDVLHERGLIGFEEKPVYIGGPNVPRRPDKMGHQ